LKKEIRKELEKIQEMTPSGKERAAWREHRDDARAAIDRAERTGAPGYARNYWDEATGLFSRAKEYAAGRSYRKASYLARKAGEAASRAADEAERVRSEKERSARAVLNQVKKSIDAMALKVPSDNRDLLVRKTEFLLEYSDLVSAMSLEQYDEVLEKAPELRKAILLFGSGLDSYGD